MLLGSGFSSAFAEVILLTDAVIILLVLIMAFPDRIAALVHRTATAITGIVTYIGSSARHR